MTNHDYLRWVSQINAMQLILAHLQTTANASKRGLEDLAEHAEELARNIRRVANHQGDEP